MGCRQMSSATIQTISGTSSVYYLNEPWSASMDIENTEQEARNEKTGKMAHMTVSV